MERSRTYKFLTLILMTGSMIYANEKPQCKDGVCPYQPSKKNHEVKPEDAVVNHNAVIEVTVENFESVVKNSTKPVVVDFYATWCQPCKIMKPIFTELAQEEKEWTFVAIDGDKYSALTASCGVKAFPTFVVFKNGAQWGKIEGGRSKEQFMPEFKKIIASEQPFALSQADVIMELLTAISIEDVNAIKKSIAGGVDLNGTLETLQGNLSALSVAILTGSEEIIDLLIKSGAKMDKSVEELTNKQINVSVVMIESLQKNFDYIKNKIAALPAPIKQVVKMSGAELGMQFVQVMESQDELKKLIDRGADVNTVFMLGKNQTVPICMAMLMNNIVAIDTFIAAGASLSIEIIDENGVKKSLEQGIKDDIETYNQGIIRIRERFAFALSKNK